jgi:hypothetical protein
LPLERAPAAATAGLSSLQESKAPLRKAEGASRVPAVAGEQIVRPGPKTRARRPGSPQAAIGAEFDMRPSRRLSLSFSAADFSFQRTEEEIVMIRSATSKAVLLTAAALFTSAAFVNCSSTKNTTTAAADVGSVGLAVKLSTGVNVDKVDYKVSGNGITPVTGSIVVSDPGATVSVLVNGLPAGTGYLVELTAVSTDGKTTCGGSSTFDIIANQSSSVTVALQCKTPKTTGSVVVGGTFNNCPALTSFSASPLAVAVGGIITVGSAASDLDPGTMLTFAWTATAGTFAAPTSASTTYTCAVGGSQTLTITVSDGKCTDSATVPVTCVALDCGNGMVQPDKGEQCDPPSAANHCDQNCQIIPVCGNMVKEGTEQCDPPNGVTCDQSCKNIPIVCGNNIVQPGESCDPPNGTTCGATCQTIAPAMCGNGVVEAGEDCEPPSTATCDSKCKKIDVCAVCETAQCDPTISGCDSLTGAAKTACTALLACVRTKHCAPAGDVQPCYCGTATDIGCLGGGGNGLCKAEVEAAAQSTDPGAIAERFVDPAFPVGRAANLIGCDHDSCSTKCPL